VGTPPFNVFAILLVPLYACISDMTTVRKINTIFAKAVYAPIALLMSVVFAAFSLLMVPFAYLFALYGKM